MKNSVILFIIVFSILLLVYIYFYNKNTSHTPSLSIKMSRGEEIRETNKTLHMAHVYMKNNINDFKFINNEKFPSDCIVHNYQIKNYDELPKFLDTIYSWNIRHFIGFYDSEMIKISLNFFETHPDVILISCLNTLNFPNLPKNILSLTSPNSIHTINLRNSIIILCKYWKNNVKVIDIGSNV